MCRIIFCLILITALSLLVKFHQKTEDEVLYKISLPVLWAEWMGAADVAAIHMVLGYVYSFRWVLTYVHIGVKKNVFTYGGTNRQDLWLALRSLTLPLGRIAKLFYLKYCEEKPKYSLE